MAEKAFDKVYGEADNGMLRLMNVSGEWRW